MANYPQAISGVIERALRHDRLKVAFALVAITALAWTYLLSGAGMGMSALDMTRMAYGDHSVMKHGMTMPFSWTMAHALTVFGMWWLMMIAMMLPGAAPVILLAAMINRRSTATPPFGPTWGFLAGYLLAWGGFSLAATVAQWALQASGLLLAMTLATSSRELAGALFLGAALWQLTPLKQACLRHCQSPAGFLVASRRRTALSTGIIHGAYCVGCCWLLMLLLFVGGVMNLLWIFALAFYVLLEKLLPRMWLPPPVTAALLAATGILTLVP